MRPFQRMNRSSPHRMGQSFTRQISASPTPGAANVLQALNQPPTISPITDVNVVVGQTISFAVSGHDLDGSSQTLTYVLASGAPTGAGIDPVSGMFTWTPTTDQRGTNLLTARVTRQWHATTEARLRASESSWQFPTSHLQSLRSQM